VLTQANLALHQVVYLFVETVLAIGSQPVAHFSLTVGCGVGLVAKIKLHRQLQMDMTSALPTIIDAVKFPDRSTPVVNRQIVGYEVSVGVLAQEKMPQLFEVKSQARGWIFCQKRQQWAGVPVQGFQPGATLRCQLQGTVVHVAGFFIYLAG
jgi:hypothetical protein